MLRECKSANRFPAGDRFDPWIPLGIGVYDPSGTVGGAVVYNDDLKFPICLTAHALKAPPYHFFNVIRWNNYGYNTVHRISCLNDSHFSKAILFNNSF